MDRVPHGFRSAFRAWTQEQTNVQREVAAAALAHVNLNKVEMVYARSDYFEHRRLLMQMWANLLDGKNVVEEVRIGASGVGE